MACLSPCVGTDSSEEVTFLSKIRYVFEIPELNLVSLD